MTGDEVAAVLARLPELVNGREALVRRGRFLSGEFMVEADDVAVHLKIHEGKVVEVAKGPFRMRSWIFAVRAEAQAWTRFWQEMPEPGYHDVIAMTRLGVARLEGDLQPLMANLRYIKEVLEAPRDRA